MKDFSQLLAKAHEAGMAAVQSANVQPMVVLGGGGQKWFVEDGVCGFAWVNLKPGNSPLANFMKKAKLAGPAYEGGVNHWVSGFGQSMQKKEAYGAAYAAVLRDAGFKAYMMSRMD